MKVLVTGTSGFIGCHLTDQLIRGGFEVAGLFLDRGNFERSQFYRTPSPKAKLIPYFANLRDSQSTSEVVEAIRPDIVIHLAAVGVADPFLPVEQAVADNILGTNNLLKSCFDKESQYWPRKMIVARTAGEEQPINVYTASKAAAWTYGSMFSRAYSWPIVGAMIFQAFGPHQPAKMIVPSAFDAAVSGRDFPMTGGQQMKDWIYIDDVITGILSMIPVDIKPGSTVEIGTGVATPVINIIEAIYDLTKGTGRPLPGKIPSRSGEARIQAADSVRSRIQTGWSAQIPWTEGLSRFHNWFSTQST